MDRRTIRSRGSKALITVVISVGALLTQHVGPALAAAGDPLVLGANNSAGVGETLLHSAVGGDKATLALYNDLPAGTPTAPDTMRVFATDNVGSGIQVFAGNGTFSPSPQKGTGIRVTSRGHGIWSKTLDNKFAVLAEAPQGTGVSASGKNFGVVASSSSANGTGVAGVAVQPASTGVKAIADGLDRTALDVSGAAKFSTSGLATVLKGQKAVTVPLAQIVDVTPQSKVLCTPQTDGGALKFCSRDAVSDTITITLTGKAKTDVEVAYFVIS